MTRLADQPSRRPTPSTLRYGLDVGAGYDLLMPAEVIRVKGSPGERYRAWIALSPLISTQSYLPSKPLRRSKAKCAGRMLLKEPEMHE